ncbi:MAG: hypothetical protein ACI828_000955 [Flavobacteriales bacterium]|jgi:hypothetical protein
MSAKNTNNTLKFLTLVLAILLVSLGIYTVTFYNEVKDNEAQLQIEKDLIMEELGEEVDRYDLVLRENTVITNRLEAAKIEILALQEKLKAQEATRDVVREYQFELHELRREREFIFKQNDSLIRETQRLSQLQENTQDALNKATLRQDSISSENRDLTSKLTQGAQLTASLTSVRGVIQRNNGKFTSTVRASRAEMIQVNYTVNENRLTTTGDMPFYTQITGPSGRIIGTPRDITFDDGTQLSYNNRIIVPYTKVQFKVSELILGSGTFELGTYQILVFQGSRQVLSEILTLK